MYHTKLKLASMSFEEFFDLIVLHFFLKKQHSRVYKAALSRIQVCVFPYSPLEYASLRIPLLLFAFDFSCELSRVHAAVSRFFCLYVLFCLLLLAPFFSPLLRVPILYFFGFLSIVYASFCFCSYACPSDPVATCTMYAPGAYVRRFHLVFVCQVHDVLQLLQYVYRTFLFVVLYYFHFVFAEDILPLRSLAVQ